MKGIGGYLKRSYLHLIYPTKCLHCHALLPPETVVICEACAALLELIDPDERCRVCFNPLSSQEWRCQTCLQYPSAFDRMGAAFDYAGPAASLVKRLKYGQQPYLAKGMAAFLVAQWDCLQWPMPDVLVPVPISWTHWLERGYNQSALLAEEMGKLLGCPVWHVLKRRSGDYSQAALTLEQRQLLGRHRFTLKKKCNLQDKKVLMVDDVMTTGSTLQRCAEALSAAGPAALYAMTFCRTLLKD